MKKSRFEIVVERTVHAGDGARWHVREARAIDIPGAMTDTCLIFDGASVCRRFWTYPKDWSGLPENEIMAIMDGPR
jgi:hypothetical protein